MMEQTQGEMHSKIKRSSNRKILRRQVELLAEYSHLPIGTRRIPESSCAMARLYPELVKAEILSVLRSAVLLGVFLCLLYGFIVRTTHLNERRL